MRKKTRAQGGRWRTKGERKTRGGGQRPAGKTCQTVARLCRYEVKPDNTVIDKRIRQDRLQNTYLGEGCERYKTWKAVIVDLIRSRSRFLISVSFIIHSLIFYFTFSYTCMKIIVSKYNFKYLFFPLCPLYSIFSAVFLLIFIEISIGDYILNLRI